MGLSTAQLLSSRGARISLADVNEAGLEAAMLTLDAGSDRNLSGAHMCTVVDVRSTESVDAWIDATVAKYGRLDGAVNMAGVIRPAAPTEEVSDGDWEFIMGVNATGVFKCLRAEIRAMKGNDMPGGSIVSAAGRD